MVDVRGLWDFDDPVGSEQRFRAAAAGGGDREVMLTQVARALGLQGRYAEGHAELDRLEAEGGGTSGSEPSGSETAVRIALERGRLHRSAGRPDQAEPCFEQAVQLAEAAGLEGLRVDALHMLALVPEDPDTQVHRGIAALQVARAATDPEARRWVPALLHNIGMALVDRGDLVEAESVLAEALHERKEQGGDPQEVRWAEESLADVRGLLDGSAP